MNELPTQTQFWLNDLRWLLLSAPLLNPQKPSYTAVTVAFSENECQSISHWLNEVTQSASLLEQFTQWMGSKPNRHIARLGRYAEHLLEFFLRHGPTHRLEAANLQVHAAIGGSGSKSKSKSTLGEIDFLVTSQLSMRREHWELAVKFFICPDVAPTDDPPSALRLIGPDSVDSLAAKTAKLLDRQIRQLPPAPFNAFDWLGLAFTRGWIFYRREKFMPVIDELNLHHGRGTWLEFSKLSELECDGAPFVLLPRQRWLAPLQMQSALQEQRDVQLLNVNQLRLAISELWGGRTAGAKWPAGVLVSKMALAPELANTINNRLIETERIMVMPDSHSCM